MCPDGAYFLEALALSFVLLRTIGHLQLALTDGPLHLLHCSGMGPLSPSVCRSSMIRKSGNRFSLATNAKRVCAEIMLKQRDEIMMRFHLIAS
jgi:hypothetical protein